MILPSNPSWLSSILRTSAVLTVLCALAWFGWQSSSNRFSEEVFIPIPKVKHLHPMVSLEWDSQKVDPHQAGKAPTAHPGYALALAHCTRCHGLPTPQQLPRETWPFVMTWMSNYLGYTNLYGPFQNNVDSIQIPSQPMVSESELQAISEYYLLYAPLEIRPDERTTALRPGSLKQFTPRPPPMQVPEDEIITLTHWDPSRHQLYLGRASHRSLQVFDAEGQILLQKACASEPVDVTPLPNGFRLTLMGHFLEDRLGGTVMDVSVSDASSLDTQTHVEGFHRLTQCLSEDINEDGYTDLLLVGFGAGIEGRVSLFWGDAQGTFKEETILLDHAGALCARNTDLDQDGLMDLLILTAQQHQELLLFTQQVDGDFERSVLIKQGAGYGYNGFELVDWNQDERVDLLMVNGNNMEIRNAPIKNYHGIRILQQTQERTFEEALFYPFPGAIKALATDFDQDGDLDVAAIAFYPDWSQEHPLTFVYLEQKEGTLTASTTALKDWGRWMTMDAGDFNQDGYPDLILGGAYVKHGVHDLHQAHYQSLPHPSILMLDNIGAR